MHSVYHRAVGVSLHRSPAAPPPAPCFAYRALPAGLSSARPRVCRSLSPRASTLNTRCSTPGSTRAARSRAPPPPPAPLCIYVAPHPRPPLLQLPVLSAQCLQLRFQPALLSHGAPQALVLTPHARCNLLQTGCPLPQQQQLTRLRVVLLPRRLLLHPPQQQLVLLPQSAQLALSTPHLPLLRLHLGRELLCG